MNENFIRLFPEAAPREPAESPVVRERRRRWMRRLLVLMIGACAAFGLAAIWLSRMATPLYLAEADLQAVTLMRTHLQALERGDLKTAYGQYSRRYRREMPFEEFNAMIQDHWPVFEGRNLKMIPQAESSDRVILDLQPSSENARSVAEFTLVRIRDHWWIDDIEWYHRGSDHLIRA